MGFAKFFEDISDRYFESEHLSGIWESHFGPKPNRVIPTSADPLDRPRRLIRDFWEHYRNPGDAVPDGEWDTHHQNVKSLLAVLQHAGDIDETTPDAWDRLTGVEVRLRDFFLKRPHYGPLSHQVIRRVADDSFAIRSRCSAIIKELNTVIKLSKAATPACQEVLAAKAQFDEIRENLERDLAECKRYDQLTKDSRALGDNFLRLYRIFAVQARYRPALQQLHRLRLNEEQEAYVSRDHAGAFRIQGASGSGKTIILIHRTLRLALENPGRTVRVFTINRSLADLIRSSIVAVHGCVPPNVHVAAFYDFAVGVLGLFEDASKFRLVDDHSGERIAGSWDDFYNHRGTSPSVNVFAEQAVRDLVGYLTGHSKVTVDASRYLRDETTFIVSGYRSGERRKYRDTATEPRKQRSIGLSPAQRMLSVLVVEAWEEWLQEGDLCDVEGLSLRAADRFEDSDSAKLVRETFPTDFILADEVQDFSTIELKMLRLLVADPSGKNALFLVGDRNQKVFAKHHRTAQAGYNFRGNAAVIRQNYRNTRQILQAAYCLPREFPPPDEEDLPFADPNYSSFEGGPPVVIQCTPGDHATTILGFLKLRRTSRVAVVSDNVSLLEVVHAEADRLGFKTYKLYRTEDTDLWQPQGNVLEAEVVFSRLESVKGFEFDTVVVCDLSAGVIPRPGRPEAEYWVDAAMLYTAMTRARDELILTYVDERSLFLKVMATETVDGSVGNLCEVLASL